MKALCKLGFDIVYVCSLILTFRGNQLPQLSGLTELRSDRQPLNLVYAEAIASTRKTEAAGSSETSVATCKPKQR